MDKNSKELIKAAKKDYTTKKKAIKAAEKTAKKAVDEKKREAKEVVQLNKLLRKLLPKDKSEVIMGMIIDEMKSAADKESTEEAVSLTPVEV